MRGQGRPATLRSIAFPARPEPRGLFASRRSFPVLNDVVVPFWKTFNARGAAFTPKFFLVAAGDQLGSFVASEVGHAAYRAVETQPAVLQQGDLPVVEWV